MTAAMPLVDKVAKYDLPRAVRPTHVRRYFARKDFCRATQTAPSDKYFGIIPPERCPGKTKFYTFAAYLRHALPDAVVSARFYDVVLRRNHLVRTLGHTHALSFAEKLRRFRLVGTRTDHTKEFGDIFIAGIHTTAVHFPCASACHDRFTSGSGSGFRSDFGTD